jgi:D-alanyl-D-alanine carboxypeptidase/D-alanyl-D-alanine-endopeptidase (penicillin-binding protein 4)
MSCIRWILPAFFLCTEGSAFTVQSANGQSASKLRPEIEQLKSDTNLTHASWSICVLDAKKDSVIAEYNSQLSLVPASIQKIITTSTALSLLGWDFKYQTFLEYDGKLDSAKRILHGNLYIKGNGDPTLGSETFRKKSDTVPLTDQWAKILQAKGIQKIDGAVIGDASSFEDEMIPSTWIWGDIGNYYGAGASGLNYMDNKFSLYYKSGSKKGDTAYVTEISPFVLGLKVVSTVRTGLYLDNAYIYGAPYDPLRYVKGTVPANKKDYEVEGSIPDPSLFCAQALDSSLKKIGITIEKKPTTVKIQNSESRIQNSEPRTRLFTQTSHTLDKIIYQTNIQSNNLFAESILKTIALKKTKFGEDQAGIDIITNYWRSKGIDLKGFYMADGCGLSRHNAITTKHLVKILQLISTDTLVFKKLYESLPVAGKSGSLGKLCKGTCAENNLHAKSGYMTRVRSYAGYVTSKKGNLLTFAIIVNNYDCSPQLMKDKLEELMIAIAETD